MSSAQSDFREYQLGETPADWTNVWRSTAYQPVVYGSAYPSWNAALRLEGAQGGALWTALDQDAANNGAIEVVAKFRCTTFAGTTYLLIGALANGSALAIELNAAAAGTCNLVSIPAGSTSWSPSTLASAFAPGLAVYGTYWARLRLQTDTGGHLKAKVWKDTATEPGAWQADVTGTGTPVGRVGFTGGNAGTCVMYLDAISVANAGATASATFPATLDAILADPSYNLSMTAEVKVADGDGNNEVSRWFADRIRSCGPADYPANVAMPGVLQMQGETSVDLGEDGFFSGVAAQSQASLMLSNLMIGNMPILDYLALRSLAGRRVTFRVGDSGARSHRAFTVLRGATIQGEPVFQDQNVEIQLATPTQILDATLAVRKYIGINTAFYGRATAPGNSAYSISSFVLVVRWRPFLAAAQDVLTHGGVWTVNVSNTSVTVTIATSTTPIVLSGTTDPNLTNTADWHYAAIIVDGVSTATLIVDGFVSQTIKGSATPTASAGTIVLGVPASETLAAAMDFRLYGGPHSVDEVLSMMEQATTGTEPDLIGFWRGDDATGTTITDYSVLANHATGLTGAFVPSDEGTIDLAGKPKAQVFGYVDNGPAVHADPLRDRYRLADRGGTASWGGVQDDKLTIYAKGLAVSPTAASAVTYFGGAQTDPVTFKQANSPATGGIYGAPNRTFRTYLATILSRCGGLKTTTTTPAATCDGGGSFPWGVGNIIDTPRKASDLVRELASPLGASLYVNPEGAVAPVFLTPPCGPGPYGDMVPVLEILPSTQYEYSIVPSWIVGTAGPQQWAFWCKPFSTSGNAEDYLNRPGGTGGVDAHVLGGFVNLRTFGASDGAAFVVTGAGVTEPTITGAVTYGKWYLVTISYDPTFNSNAGAIAVSVYDVGSGQKATTQTAFHTPVASMPLSQDSLGTYYLPIGGSLFHGAICDLAWWNGGGMNSNQIWSLLDVRPPAVVLGGLISPVLYMSLSEGKGSTTVLETIGGKSYPVRNARWAPQRLLDLGRQGQAQVSWRSLRPAWQVTQTYRKNFAPLKDADIAATVTQTERIRLRAASQSTGISDPTLQALPGARPIPLGDSLLVDQGHSREIVRRVKQRFAPGAEIASVVNGNRDLATLRPNDEVWLKVPRYGLDSGGAFRAVKIAPDWATMRVGLSLWGLGGRFSGTYLLIDENTGDFLTIDSVTGDRLRLD